MVQTLTHSSKLIQPAGEPSDSKSLRAFSCSTISVKSLPAQKSREFVMCRLKRGAPSKHKLPLIALCSFKFWITSPKTFILKSPGVDPQICESSEVKKSFENERVQQMYKIAKPLPRIILPHSTPLLVIDRSRGSHARVLVNVNRINKVLDIPTCKITTKRQTKRW